MTLNERVANILKASPLKFAEQVAVFGALEMFMQMFDSNTMEAFRKTYGTDAFDVINNEWLRCIEEHIKDVG